MRYLALLALLTTPAHADPADIVAADLARGAAGWTVSVTLRHGDTGWDDYADGWRVETPDGRVLGTRELLHPHVDEQPFTRSLRGIALPADTARVAIRARTLTEGWGDRTLTVDVPKDSSRP